MSRGRPKELVIEPKPIKFECRYEDDECVEIWKYDLNKFDKGPISVDIIYKAGIVKGWGDKLKEFKNTKKIANQMKKIKNKDHGKQTPIKRRISSRIN